MLRHELKENPAPSPRDVWAKALTSRKIIILIYKVIRDLIDTRFVQETEDILA